MNKAGETCFKKPANLNSGPCTVKIICRFLLYIYNFSNVYFFQLTAQVCDTTSKIVPLIALNLLDEAADDKMNLEAMVCSSLHSKDLKHLGKYLYMFIT